MKNESPEIKDKIVEVNKRILSSFFKEMSKSEKLFWGTIAVFFLIFIAISILASFNQSEDTELEAFCIVILSVSPKYSGS